MYQLGILQGFRRLSKTQQQIIRNLQVAVRPTLHNNGNICHTRALLVRRQEHLLHENRRSFLKVHAKKVLTYCAVRWYTPLPVQPKDGELIYTGTLGKAVLGVKFFSYSSSMFSLCVMPYVLMKTGIGVNSLALQVAFCGIIGFFTFMTPVLLHLITKGYVVRLYHNKETDMYTAITYSALLVEKRTVFHQSHVVIPHVSRMFTSFYAKKHSMLVNPMLFPLPHDYNHLMGYDRPFSFDTDDLNKPDKS
ncbi:transmembrane protein 70, mitochondrial-like [Sinocyclocheilus anshuiensis]|uniref:Transmembrane protein 70, mitochondrial-like n=1 Tax=Sinocyclocheilus anshuiensis TaxID=1608454 RepID=A0A671K5Q0_9TELE|nr:PREDICTED: transmembrane protein 70, mitochondrial-like [Sinocyclocheilus anshuiensis]